VRKTRQAVSQITQRRNVAAAREMRRKSAHRRTMKI